MTTRERWLTFGLFVAGALLVVLAIWQHVRYSDAENAVRQYVDLESRADRARREGDSDTADRLRPVRQELRTLLSRADFNAALKRQSALNEEEGDFNTAEKNGKTASTDELWPPKSKEREQAREVLKLLAEKQKKGYDMGPAHDALLRVADSARAGKKKEALAAFEEVQARIKDAKLRPGFQEEQKQPAPEADNGTGEGKTPEISDAKIAQAVQFLRQILTNMPQILSNNQIPAEQKENFKRVEPLAREFIAAYDQGKDVRVVQPLFEKVQKVQQSGNIKAAEKLIAQAREMLKNAPMRKGFKPGVPGQPAQPAPGAVPPVLPAVPGTQHPSVSPDQILTQIDRLRKMPDPEYQKQRPQLAKLLSGLLAGGGAPAPVPGSAPGPGASQGVGDPAAVRLDIAMNSAISGLHVLGRNVSEGLPVGGLALAGPDGKETPLFTKLRQEGSALAQRISRPEGLILVKYEAKGKEILCKVTARRDQPGTPGDLLLRIPLRAAGWWWHAGNEVQVMSVDGTFAARPAKGGTLDPVKLRGSGVAVTVTAPTASAVTWDPAGSFLTVRLPISGQKGMSEHTVRLTASNE